MPDLTKLYDRTNPDLWAHPEIRDYFEMGEAPSNTFEMFDPDVPFEKRRKDIKALEKTSQAAYPVITDEYTKIYQIPGCPEEPDTPTSAIVTQPKNSKRKKKPCILQIPCGGLAVCWDFFHFNDEFCERFGAVSISCHYRTCFDDNGSYPAAVNDVHAAYKWVVDNADMLGVNPDKIIIFGISSGGHLGLSVAHRLKRYNYHGHCPRGIVLWVPVPDERAIYGSSTRLTPAWGGEQVFDYGFGWLGLKGLYSPQVSPEAFANHATAEECVGLPPTFIHTGENDPCADACMSYASKLIKAGVYTNLDVWGGSNHAAMEIGKSQPDFEDSPYCKRWWEMICAQIGDALKYDFRRAWIADLVD